MRQATRLILTLSILVNPVRGAVIQVPGDAASIQDGIVSAGAGDTVLVAPGIYLENIDFLGKAVTVASHFILDPDPGHIDATVIDGGGSTQIDSLSAVVFGNDEDESSVLMGFTIQGGEGTLIARDDIWGNPQILWVGGGAYCRASSPSILHNKFRDNHCHAGGGLYLENSRALVSHCEFHGNTGGGGALCLWESDARIVDNHFEGNSSGAGGAVAIHGQLESGSVISHNAIIANSSSDHAAGILVSPLTYPQMGFTARIEFNRIEANIADMGGGGIYVQRSAPVIYRNRIHHNVAMGWTGGGVRCVDAEPFIVNNTFYGNASYGGGGGGAISFFDGTDDPVPVIANNIIAGSFGMRAVKCNPNLNKVGYNDFWDNENQDIDCTLIYPNIFVDPMFASPETGDFRLEEGSECIDAGVAFWEVEGEIWVDLPDSAYLGDAPDMGALEFDDPTGVDADGATPGPIRFLGVHPNPFNPGTKISYALTEKAVVRLCIFDIGGRCLRHLVAGALLEAGPHEVVWDGKDGSGRTLASGLYFTKLRAGDQVLTRKLTLLK